jgi:hypothetical protein
MWSASVSRILEELITKAGEGELTDNFHGINDGEQLVIKVNKMREDKSNVHNAAEESTVAQPTSIGFVTQKIRDFTEMNKTCTLELFLCFLYDILVEVDEFDRLAKVSLPF